MADRYWVGGTGTWDSATTTNWSASSGGAGGASLPTAADNVFFDANSNVGTGAFTVTMANSPRVCNDFTASGLDGTMTLAGASNVALNVSGSLTWPATGFIRTYTGVTTFNATTTGKTVTTNGATFAGTVTFDGVGGGWTLGSAITASNRTLFVYNGTFDTSSSGNYTVTVQIFYSSASSARTINLNASTVNVSVSSTAWDMTTSTNATLNAGTSTINCSGSTAIFAGGGLAYYNVAFTSTTADTKSITGANTFNNLSVTAPASAGVSTLIFLANQTISGTLSTTGTAGNRRVFFASATYGIGFTLTCNSAASLTDADFRDIYVKGTAAPISGTRIGNRGNNSGITFSTPKTVYWNLAGAQNWSADAWATTPTGTPSTDNFPLPQDTATFTNAGSVTGTITLNTAIAYVPTVNMSGRTSAMTLGTSSATTVYGNWTNGSGTAFTGTALLTFSGGTTQTITSAGKTFSGGITVDTYGGTVQLADAFSVGANTLTVTNGTFTTAGFAVTAGTLSSNNSNVRAINLGASTVTIGASGASLNFTVATNFTFNAGTSQITFAGAPTFFGGGLTFYNVSITFTGAAGTTPYISGQNTFNNLTIGPRATDNIRLFYFFNNQTINGTLTCAGATATRRVFLFSDTIGTRRTLTVNSLSADDCDFCDIVIAGTASGSSPTRAGDCGNNSGITFPAPKTVYWNLAGTVNWSATGWCTASGGTPAVNNFPLAQDIAVFDDAGSAGTVTIDAAWNIGTFNASARTSAMTFNTSTLVPVVYGNWLFGTGVTSLSNSGAITFSKNGTQTITSNGVQFGCPITINNSNTYVQLADALSLNSARTLTLTTGTFDAVTYNVTTGLFSAGTATLKMGSGTWTLSGTGIVWVAVSTTTVIVGTSNIVLSDTSTGGRTFVGGDLYYNKLTIGGTTGISTLTITDSNTFGELASTKTVAHTIAFGFTTQRFGKWSVTGTVGNVVTITGTSNANVIAGPAVTGVNYLAMGTWGIDTFSPGEFYAGANSTGTAAAPVFRTAAPAPRTLYWVGGTGNWSSTTKWSTSSGGASGAAIPTSLDSVIFNSASNATAYTATIDPGVATVRCASFTMAGPASGNVTFAGAVAIAFHGNVSFAATGITRTYTGTMVWAGNASYTFTTNGLTLASTTIVNGIGATWTLGSALTATGIIITVTYGTFNTSSGNYAVTTAAISSSNLNIRTINLNGSTVSLSTTAIAWSMTNSVNATVNAGTSTISSSGTSAAFAGGGLTYYNVEFTSTALTSPSITGANTFNNLTITGRTTLGIGVLSLSANQTINGTLTVSAGTASSYRMQISSDTFNTTRTLTCAAVSLTDTDFRDITIAGAASPASGTRLGNCKGNSNITFDAAKTVYYRNASSANWGGNQWSATSGGSPDATQFPLAQDTAVFPAATYPASGSTITINANYNIGTIDMSLRTSNTMTLATSLNDLAIYGNWINGTGTTLSGTGSLTFAGRTTQQITSSSKTFTQSIAINSPSGSVTLQDALTQSSTRQTSLSNGTLDLNGLTYTVGTSFAIGGGTKNLTFNGGTLVCPAATVTSFNNATPTNFTTTAGTGTGTISMTAATAKTFVGGGSTFNCTLNQGGAGALTISGDNTFANITNTSGVATTLNLAATTQRVGAFTATGTVGNLLTITGTSAASPATLIYTGGGAIIGLDYLVPTSIRAYSPTTTWYAGNNSTNGGSLGWIFASGSGTIYAVYIDESNTVSDAIRGGFLYVSAVADSATATDAIRGGFLYVSAVADNATATDNFLVAPSIFNAPVANSATATDAISGKLVLIGAVADTATATDSPSVAASTFNAPVTNTATITDVITNAGSIYNAPVADTATVTDAIRSNPAFSSVITDTATATDSPLVAPSTFNAPVANTATATDNFLVAPSTFNAPFVDTTSITDVITNAGSIYNAPVTNTATATDVFIGSFLWNLIDDSQTITWTPIPTDTPTTWDLVDDTTPTTWQNINNVN